MPYVVRLVCNRFLCWCSVTGFFFSFSSHNTHTTHNTCRVYKNWKALRWIKNGPNKCIWPVRYFEVAVASCYCSSTRCFCSSRKVRKISRTQAQYSNFMIVYEILFLVDTHKKSPELTVWSISYTFKFSLLLLLMFFLHICTIHSIVSTTFCDEIVTVSRYHGISYTYI